MAMIDSCKDPGLLSALLDGELPPEEKQAVERHLRSCPDCRRQMEALARNDGLLRQMPALQPSDGFDRVFWEKVERLPAPSPRRPWLLTGWRPLLAGGVAGLAVAVLIAYGPHKAPSPEDMFIAEHMEMLEDYDLIRNLDMLENWEVLETMDTSETKS